MTPDFAFRFFVSDDCRLSASNGSGGWGKEKERANERGCRTTVARIRKKTTPRALRPACLKTTLYRDSHARSPREMLPKWVRSRVIPRHVLHCSTHVLWPTLVSMHSRQVLCHILLIFTRPRHTNTISTMEYSPVISSSATPSPCPLFLALPPSMDPQAHKHHHQQRTDLSGIFLYNYNRTR